MDAARPDPTDRFAVRLHRSVHLALPLAVAYLVLLFGWPAISRGLPGQAPVGLPSRTVVCVPSAT